MSAIITTASSTEANDAPRPVSDRERSPRKRWEVSGRKGVVVRSGPELSSAEIGCVETGAVITTEGDAVRASSGALRVRAVSPVAGWVSVKCLSERDSSRDSSRDLSRDLSREATRFVQRENNAKDDHQKEDSAVKIADFRARWAVDVSPTTWDPSALEWRFLLSLVTEPEEREQVCKYRRRPDQIKALISRLLARRCCGVALNVDHHDITISRTKGRKPFLTKSSRMASPFTLAECPNFNFNVSHEGNLVVLASEPRCLVGVDVAAPDQFRSDRAFDLDKFFKTMRNVLTEREWEQVRAVESRDDRATRFRCFWSCKEAFTKARGDGIAFGLNRADFTLEWASACSVDDDDDDDDDANGSLCDATYETDATPSALTVDPNECASCFFTATVAVDGHKLDQWRFFGTELRDGHIVTVARGPPEDIQDAVGAFKRTFSHDRLDLQDFEAPQPPFAFLAIRDLVPPALKSDFDAILKAVDEETSSSSCASSATGGGDATAVSEKPPASSSSSSAAGATVDSIDCDDACAAPVPPGPATTSSSSANAVLPASQETEDAATAEEAEEVVVG